MQPRPEGGLWAAARLVRSEPRHCRWRGAKLRLRAGLQRALGRLSLGLSRGRCLVSQMVVSDREPFPHTAQYFLVSGALGPLSVCAFRQSSGSTLRYRVVWRSTPRVLFVPCGERTAYYPVQPPAPAARGLGVAGARARALSPAPTVVRTTRADGGRRPLRFVDSCVSTQSGVRIRRNLCIREGVRKRTPCVCIYRTPTRSRKRTNPRICTHHRTTAARTKNICVDTAASGA